MDRELLAVVQAERQDRVKCFAPGCKRYVYRQIHIILENGVIRVLGSDCFNRLFSGTEFSRSTPSLTSSIGRLLSVEERQLLISNTEDLIAKFRREHEEQLALLQRTSSSPHQVFHDILRTEDLVHWAPPEPVNATSAERAEAIILAKERLKARLQGIDFDDPSYRRLVDAEVEKVLSDKLA